VRRHWPKHSIGEERVLTWFAWLPVWIRDKTGTHMRWLEHVKVRQLYTECRSSDAWVNREFLEIKEDV
jgi:hypothetical protein